LRAHPTVAGRVSADSLRTEVILAVNFDDQSSLGAEKICRVFSQRLLASELLTAALTIAEKLPRQLLE
jgi:hypothetical protein